MAYNEKYIRDFKKKDYTNYLSDRNALKEIADAYINQYQNPTYDCTIAFKESLDHYILKQIQENASFIKSTQFKNYVDYLNYIFRNRISSGNNHLEYNTNIVFSDEVAKNLILSHYNNSNQNKLREIIKQNEQKITLISNKLEKKEKLSQIELDFIGDYLYTKKDFNSPIYSNYIEYLLNEMQNNPQLSNSPQVIAGYIAYLPAFFQNRCENSRILLTNGYSNNHNSILPSVLNNIVKQEKGKNIYEKTIRYLGLYSSGDKYISISKHELNLSLTSDKSLDTPRTMEKRDLYWISMVCFHELSHQYQARHMKDLKFNNSGFSMILKNLISNKKDYSNNHDSYEIEIEADEISWKKMYDYIKKFRLEKAKDTDKPYILKQMKKCEKNQKAVYSRRTFLTKKFSQKSDYFKEDMQIINQNFKISNNYAIYFKKMRENYPMLQRVFTDDGKIKTTIILNENITSKNMSGAENNIIGSEVANYILTNSYDTLKEHIKQDDLTEKQILNLMINIYNTYHLDKMYIRELTQVISKLNDDKNFDLDKKHVEALKKLYDGTKHNFDLNNIREKYLERFTRTAELIYKERELVHIIKNRYPTYDIENFAKPKYAIWNYEDTFNYLYNSSKGVIYENELDDLLTKYEKSNDEVLMNLAQKTRKSLIPSQINNTSDLAKNDTFRNANN